MQDRAAEHAATQKEQTRAIFDLLAPDYDTVGPGHFAYFGQRLVELVGVGAGDQVLDVATGRGAILFPAAGRVGPTGQVVGIDLAEGMVAATRAEAAQRRVPVRIEAMDAEQLQFLDAAFDSVLCGFGVMFFPNLRRALAEIRRVLKPGGRLGVSTWRVSQSEDLAAVLATVGPPSARPPGWITEPPELARILREAEFAEVEVRVESHPFRYADLDQYWASARTTGRWAALDALDAAQQAQVRAALTERLQPVTQADGIQVVASALLATARR